MKRKGGENMPDLNVFNFWNQQVAWTGCHSAQAVLRQANASTRGAFARDVAGANSCGAGSCNCGGGCNGECGSCNGD